MELDLKPKYNYNLNIFIQKGLTVLEYTIEEYKEYKKNFQENYFVVFNTLEVRLSYGFFRFSFKTNDLCQYVSELAYKYNLNYSSGHNFSHFVEINLSESSIDDIKSFLKELLLTDTLRYKAYKKELKEYKLKEEGYKKLISEFTSLITIPALKESVEKNILINPEKYYTSPTAQHNRLIKALDKLN